MPENQIPLGDFLVDYSKSNRSKCKLSGKNIPKNVLRIGKMVRSDVDSFGGNFPEWYNFEDFVKDEDLVDKLKNHQVWGMENLKDQDREILENLLKKDNKKRSLDIKIDEDELASKKTKMTLTRTSVLEEFSNDLIYEISKYLNAESFTTLSLLNSRMYGKFNSCLCDMMNRNEFVSCMRSKRVDPRLSVQIVTTLPTIIAEYKKNLSLSFSILFMALDRHPGGNSDEFITSWKLKFKSNKPVQIKKGSVHSWDGSLSGNRSMKIQIARTYTNLIMNIMRLSFDTPNKDNLHYFTVLDHRSDYEEYDTEWSKIKIDITLGKEKQSIFSFHQQVLYPNDRRHNTLDDKTEYPLSENAKSLIDSLKTFCGTSSPMNESEGNSISCKEPPKYPKAYCFDIEEATDKYEPLEIYMDRIFEK